MLNQILGKIRLNIIGKLFYLIKFKQLKLKKIYFFIFYIYCFIFLNFDFPKIQITGISYQFF